MCLVELCLQILHLQPEVHNLLLLLSTVATLHLFPLTTGLLKWHFGILLIFLGLLIGLHDCIELLLEVLASRR